MTTEPSRGPVAAMGSGLSGLAFLADDFTSYPDTAALRANSGPANLYTEIANADLLELDQTILYNGHPTARCLQAGDSDRNPRLSVHVTPARETVWLRATLRFSLGWRSPAAAPSDGEESAYQILGMLWEGYDAGLSVEITSGSQYGVSWKVRSRATDGEWSAEQRDGQALDEGSDARWYSYILFHQRTGGYTVRERAWWGPAGEPPLQRIDFQGVAADPVPPVSTVTLGKHSEVHRAVQQNQYLNYGQWELVDGAEHPDPFGLENG